MQFCRQWPAGGQHRNINEHRLLRQAIYDAVGKLVERPGIGHTREDLTDRPLKFWSVYSYLVVAVLHGARDVELLLEPK